MTLGTGSARKVSITGPTFLFAACLASLAAGGCLSAPAIRVFALTGGTTAASIAAAVAAVAIGAGLGATCPGSTAERAERFSGALRGLALRQCGLAASLAVAPFVFAVARAVYLFTWPLVGGSPVSTWILRLGLGLGLFGLPAAMLGGMVPALVRVIRAETRDSVIVPGFVHGLAAAGLGLGMVIGGPILIPALGIRGTFFIGLALSGLGAAGTLLLSGLGGSALGTGAEPVPGAGEAGDAPTPSGHPAVLASFLVGFALAAAWVAWDRTLALLVGPTTLNSALGAGLLMLALAAGFFVAAGVGAALPGPGATVVVVTTGSMALYGSMFVVPWLATTGASLAPRFLAGGQPLVLTALLGSLLIVPGSLVLGAGLGFIVSGPRAGRGVGWILSALLSGATCACLVTPLLLVPAFGIRRSVSLAAAMGLLAALLVVATIPFRRPATRGTATVAILALMVVLGGFPASWDPRVVAGGLYRYAGRAPERLGSPERWLETRQRGSAPLFYREGSEASVVVEDSIQVTPASGSLETETLTLDGRMAASTGTDIRTQVLTGEIPVFVHGPTDKALVVDFSTGITAGSMLRHPIRSLTVIEREPAVLRAAALFTQEANNPLGDSRLTTITDDPRARLLVDHSRYEVIVLTGLDPWLPYASGLVTSEGYALLRDRLADKGILGQRVSLASLDSGAMRTMLRTFAATFESVGVFQLTNDDLLLVGSREPLIFDAARFRSTIDSNPAVAQDIRRVVLVNPDEVFLTLRLGGDALRRLLGSGPPNDDDRTPVTVAAARDLSVHRNDALVTAIDGAWEGFGALLGNYGATTKEKADFLYTLAKSYLGLTADPVRALDIARELAGMGETARARWVTGEARLQQKDLDGAIKEWESVLAIEPDSLDALFSLGMFHLDAHDYFAADRYLGPAAKLHGDTPVVMYHYGRNLYFLGRFKEALAALQRARELGAGRETYPLIDYLDGLCQMRLGQNDEAIQSLQTYLKWAYEQTTLTRVEVDAHLKLADLLDHKGKRFEAMKEKQKADDLRARIDAWARQQEARSPSQATEPPGTAPTPAPAGGGTAPAAAPTAPAPAAPPPPGR